ncbi:carboxypeptidase-like regulatory domain-containing protein [Hymenobacter sp. BT18]|uniref:carboxypeptidase-like regulatory domain-containing protein n=1 Tax=Hymenobacter sp. BT18 TaxID=2835648 RepID=UPI00143E5236|nr:carboxypeptidase-like regulatory domain-containing protein [Hymenobacter sp. BT18]QIX62447.1 carboxypeptidase-like regulatory domain-containing protein [Hymenobacter sp. BT18]
MLFYLQLLWLASSICQQPPVPHAYHAVVVDAISGQPLRGVRVENTQAPTPFGALTTDEAGRFAVALAPVHLRLQLLGYAPLEVHRSAYPAEHPDTLRLTQQAFMLQTVTIRPEKVVTLSTVLAKGPRMTRSLNPGQAVAMLLLPPAPAEQPYYLDQVRLFVANQPTEGRLRVRLLQARPDSSGRPTPLGPDLLPQPMEYGPDQLAGLRRGQLVLDVSQHGQQLPPSGVFVVVECLPTNPADQVVSYSFPKNGKGSIKVLLSSSPATAGATHQVEASTYPTLQGQRLKGSNATWSRLDATRPWKQYAGITTNIRAELTVFTQ